MTKRSMLLAGAIAALAAATRCVSKEMLAFAQAGSTVGPSDAARPERRERPLLTADFPERLAAP